MTGKSRAAAAAQEAWEEAGALGLCLDVVLGTYELDDGRPIEVYPVVVSQMAKTYLEKGERKRKWFSLKRAAQQVQNRDLRRFLKDLRKKDLKRMIG